MVHSNAAFCRLTGIDSHTVEGKPVSSILSVKPGEIPEWPVVATYPPIEDNNNNTEHQQQSPGTDLERLLVTCGYGHLHVVQVQTQANNNNNNTHGGRMVGRNVIVNGGGGG